MIRSQSRQSGFTLIELLVVISIIALLVGILLPALSKSKAAAAYVRDNSNLRALAQTVHIYAADFKGSLPPGPSEYGISSNNLFAAGRGVWGAMGTSHPAGFPANVPYRAKGLGLLATEYDLNPDFLFDRYREEPNWPDAYFIVKHAVANKASLIANGNGFVFPSPRYVEWAGVVPGGTDPTNTNAGNTFGIKNSGQSHIEGDFFYRCGDYSTFNTTTGVMTNTDVSSKNARVEATNFNNKVFITNTRVWMQDRVGRKYSQGVGYDCVFGDASVAFFKGGDGNNVSNPTAYALLNGYTSGTVTGAAFAQPNNQSGIVVFNRADAYFGR